MDGQTDNMTDRHACNDNTPWPGGKKYQKLKNLNIKILFTKKLQTAMITHFFMRRLTISVFSHLRFEEILMHANARHSNH